jgi:hypothetical protein
LYNHGMPARPFCINKDIRHMQSEALSGFDAIVHLAELSNDPLGLLTGGDDEEPSQASSGPQQQAGEESPIPTEMGAQAILARQQGQNQLLVTASGLEPSTQNTAYQVYLSNGESDRRSLGAAVTDQQGNLSGGGPLPRNFRDYEFIDLTSVTVVGQGRNQRFEDGPVVLRGLLEVRDNPITRQGITLLGEIPLRPLPE